MKVGGLLAPPAFLQFNNTGRWPATKWYDLSFLLVVGPASRQGSFVDQVSSGK